MRILIILNVHLGKKVDRLKTLTNRKYNPFSTFDVKIEHSNFKEKVFLNILKNNGI